MNLNLMTSSVLTKPFDQQINSYCMASETRRGFYNNINAVSVKRPDSHETALSGKGFIRQTFWAVDRENTLVARQNQWGAIAAAAPRRQ